jgi:cyclopropane-fatty-acyl-phospholipid synthase
VQQLELALVKVKESGLDELLFDFRIVDYRVWAEQHRGAYDRILSCEMLEAVGLQYMPEYFASLDTMLADNGRCVIQSITFNDSNLQNSQSGGSDFLQVYIFPGGFCPTLQAVNRALLDGGTELMISHCENIGQHYGRTLQEWRRLMVGRIDYIRSLGFNEQWIRMWYYYFAYSHAMFMTRMWSDTQIVLVKYRNFEQLEVPCPRYEREYDALNWRRRQPDVHAATTKE